MTTNKDEIKGIQEHIYGLVDNKLFTKGTNNMFFTFLMAVEGEIPKNLPYSLEEYLSHNTEGAAALNAFWHNMVFAIHEYYNQ